MNTCGLCHWAWKWKNDTFSRLCPGESGACFFYPAGHSDADGWIRFDKPECSHFKPRKEEDLI